MSLFYVSTKALQRSENEAHPLTKVSASRGIVGRCRESFAGRGR